jgi:predicted dehydrogenase
MPKIRVVVVGTGSIGKRHGRLLCEQSKVLVELCEPNAAALAACLQDEKEWAGELATHASFEDALDSRPDAVVLCTPHTLHAQQSIAALDAGIHVLCEKPMAATVAEARAMVDAESRAKHRAEARPGLGAPVLAVGFTLHYHPALQVIKRLIEDGELGKVCHIHWHIGSLRTLMNSKSDYQADLHGALMLDYAHQPDQLLWMVGERPSSVFAAGGQVGELPKTSNPNVCALTYSFPSGLVATIHLNYIQHPDKGELSVVGDKGWATLDMIPPGVQYVKIGRVSSFGNCLDVAGPLALTLGTVIVGDAYHLFPNQFVSRRWFRYR